MEHPPLSPLSLERSMSEHSNYLQTFLDYLSYEADA